MKFIIPIKKETNESINDYYNKCNLWLIVFKQCLFNNINKSKLTHRNNLLTQVPCIDWVDNVTECSVITFINLYINKLSCYYDYFECCCYYKVPENIRCPGTKNSLNKIIRILEYGTLELPPLFWARKSFHDFIESTLYIKNK